MNVGLYVSRLQFKSGASITLNKDSIVVFVGPNNSGKTQSLKDIRDHLISENPPNGVSISDAAIQQIGTEDQYLDFVRKNSIIRDNSIRLPGLHLSPPTGVDNEWQKDRPIYAGRIFSELIGADDRLSAVKERTRINRSIEIPTHPLPSLDLDPDRERQTSESFNTIFGQHLMLDRGAGSVVNLHVGTRPNPAVYGGEYSPKYASEVRKQPDINEEGDGLRAAAGLFLNVIGNSKSIFLIDEPDVYLHPPQAYSAAKEILSVSAEKQLFIATHNAHFVRGLLDTNSERVMLIRLSRVDQAQSVNLIQNDVVQEIEADPLVRFSNLLEAMFFRSAIVCENEADCLFYRSLCRTECQSNIDGRVFWLSAHGKQNIRKFTRILVRLGIQVISIPDLDIINEETKLRLLFESHGGEWSDIKTEVAKLHDFLKGRKPTVSTADVKSKIIDILDGVPREQDTLFPDYIAEQIRKAMSGASPWREIKESGTKAFGRGQYQTAADRLLSKLSAQGILVPPVGEMESFYPQSEAHGMGWVNEVLRLDLRTHESLSEARDFGKAIVSAISEGERLLQTAAH